MEIIVVGMHRSGTSLLTRLVNLMGVSLGDEEGLIAPQEDNPLGFWENRDVVALNDAILVAGGGSWEHPVSFELSNIEKEDETHFCDKARSIVADFASDQSWMMKDPRLSLTLPAWDCALQDPVCLFAVRHPLQVARSLEIRNNINPLAGIALWEYYNRKALENTRGMKRLFINFQSVLRNTEEELGRIASFLIDNGMSAPLAVASATEYVNHDLPRKSSGLEDELLSENQYSFWKCLKKAASGQSADLDGVLSRASSHVLELFSKAGNDGSRSMFGSFLEVRQKHLAEGRLAELERQDAVREQLLTTHASQVREMQNAYEEQARTLENQVQALEEQRQLLEKRVQVEEKALRKAEADCLERADEMTRREQEHLSQIRGLQESHASLLEDLRESNAASLEALRQAHAASLKDLRQAHAARLEDLRQNHAARLEDFRQDHDIHVEDIRQAHASQLAGLRSEIEGLDDEVNQLLEINKQQFRAADEMSEAHAERVDELEHALAGERKDIQTLRAWLEEFGGNCLLARKSLSWRLGNSLVKCVSFCFGSRRDNVFDHLSSVYSEYEHWKASRNESDPASLPQLASPQRTGLPSLLLAALKNPSMALSLLSFSRLKNFFVVLFSEDKTFSGSVYRHYVDALATDVKDEVVTSLASERSGSPVKHPVWDDVAVSIVVPVYNQWDYTYQCLLSIERHCNSVPYEIILADDVSSDETKNATDFFPNIRVVRNKKNLGFIGNCNRAAKRARGRYIIFLNNDTLVQPGWLESLYALMEADESIAVSGSKLVYEDGTLQEAGGIIWDDATGWNYGRLADPSEPEFNYVKEVDYISGASLMVRRDFWQQVGGFDTTYCPAYFEDVELAFQARKNGYRVVYQPASVVVHFEGKSHGTDEGSGIKKYQVENRRKFLDRWRSTLKAEHYPNGKNVFHARDRSRGKNTILFIDHYVPHHDKDAGSKSTYQYLRLFVNKGYNVKFLPDNFFYHEPYTAELEQMGVEVLYGNTMARGWKDWIKANGASIDIVYMHRPHISAKYMDFCKRTLDSKILYQCHDLHFLRKEREAEVSGDPDLLQEAAKWEEVERGLFVKADVGLTFSTDELEVLKDRIPEATCAQVPLYSYEYQLSESRSFADEQRDMVFVGGFNHPPNADGVRWFVEEVLPLVVEKVPDAMFKIIGSNCPEDLLQSSCDNVEVLGFVSNEELDQVMSSARINVVPLRYGAGVKGKVVESLYQGLPLVSTAIGLEGLTDVDEIVQAADTPEHMANEIVRLYDSAPRDLEVLSEAYKEYAWRHFSADAAYGFFQSALSMADK